VLPFMQPTMLKSYCSEYIYIYIYIPKVYVYIHTHTHIVCMFFHISLKNFEHTHYHKNTIPSYYKILPLQKNSWSISLPYLPALVENI